MLEIFSIPTTRTGRSDLPEQHWPIGVELCQLADIRSSAGQSVSRSRLAIV